MSVVSPCGLSSYFICERSERNIYEIKDRYLKNIFIFAMMIGLVAQLIVMLCAQRVNIIYSCVTRTIIAGYRRKPVRARARASRACARNVREPSPAKRSEAGMTTDLNMKQLDLSTMQ